jgi:L-amino acid N-acyltransferase YncA
MILGTEMIIEPVKNISDLLQVANIYEQAYDELINTKNFGDVVRLEKPDSARIHEWSKDLYNKIKNKDIIFNLAKEKNKIIGFCFVRKKDIPDSEISHIGVVGLRISKNWRNKGIGKKLLSYTINESKDKFEILEASIFTTNKISYNMFKKFGFVVWGIAPKYVKRGKRYIDLKYMSLEL